MDQIHSVLESEMSILTLQSCKKRDVDVWMYGLYGRMGCNVINKHACDEDITR